MSRALSKHRKSHSTSALSLILGSSSPSSGGSSSSRKCVNRGVDQYPSRRSSRPSGLLPVVQESASMASLPGLSEDCGTGDNGLVERERVVGRTPKRSREGFDDFEGWLNDLRSLRSSSRRRLAALKNLERCLVSCCTTSESDRHVDTVSLSYLVQSQVHIPLIALLSRHALALKQRSSHSSLPAGDELALSLIPELEIIVSILQGLCLLSRNAKKAVGEGWVMEMFIDLLLLLRTQQASGLVWSTGSNTDKTAQPIVYYILDLLFCILVDTPMHARMFEDLGGLEAVTRLLKGTSVGKEVRMKCIEFLYFYLLPEQTTSQRATSSSSTSSGSSSDSQLYPPSPLSSLIYPEATTLKSISEAQSDSTDLSGDVPPSSDSRSKEHRWQDLDMPFIPMTPRKPAKPALGYLTPSTNRRLSSGLSSIPQSPRNNIAPSPSSKRLSTDLTERHGRRTSLIDDSGDERAWKKYDEVDQSAVGLGLGLPRSSSRTQGLSTTQREVSPTYTSSTASTPMMPQTPASPAFSDPFASESRATSNSSSSTIVPSSASSMIKSSTQPSLTIIQSSYRAQPTTVGRRPSQSKRISRSPVERSEWSETTSPKMLPPPLPTSGTPAASLSKVRHSRTHSNLSSFSVEAGSKTKLKLGESADDAILPSTTLRGVSRSSSTRSITSQRTRHSLAPSHFSNLSNTSKASATPPLPSLPPPVQDMSPDMSSSNSRMMSPSSNPKSRRAFPTNLTKGLPPSVSSPSLHSLANTSSTSSTTMTPLSASKRIPSDKGHGQMMPPSSIHRGGQGSSPLNPIVGKAVRSVEEKKGLLGEWLGNVEALVQGVEKVSFWGSVGNGSSRRSKS